MNKVNHFINGKEYIGKSDRFGDIYNPANGEKIKEVNFANKEDVSTAETKTERESKPTANS